MAVLCACVEVRACASECECVYTYMWVCVYSVNAWVSSRGMLWMWARLSMSVSECMCAGVSVCGHWYEYICVYMQVCLWGCLYILSRAMGFLWRMVVGNVVLGPSKEGACHLPMAPRFGNGQGATKKLSWWELRWLPSWVGFRSSFSPFSSTFFGVLT